MTGGSRSGVIFGKRDHAQEPKSETASLRKLRGWGKSVAHMREYPSPVVGVGWRLAGVRPCPSGGRAFRADRSGAEIGRAAKITPADALTV